MTTPVTVEQIFMLQLFMQILLEMQQPQVVQALQQPQVVQELQHLSVLTEIIGLQTARFLTLLDNLHGKIMETVILFLMHHKAQRQMVLP